MDINLIEANDGYTPLKLGSTIVGWTSPPLVVEGGRDTRLVKAVMGNKAYDFDLSALWSSYGLVEDYSGEAESRRYLADIILNMPVGSLDLTVKDHLIDYTEHTVTTLESALSNFFRLLEAHIMSDLNQKTPAQAMEIILNLRNSNYPLESLKQLSWRGKLLNDLIPPSRMVFRMQEVTSDTTSGLLLICDQINTFLDFVWLQALKMHRTVWRRADQFATENVIFLKAETEDDQLLGEMLFDEEYLCMFLKEINHQFAPECARVFLFAQADSCLTEWVMGTTITVKELHEMAVAKGLF